MGSWRAATIGRFYESVHRLGTTAPQKCDHYRKSFCRALSYMQRRQFPHIRDFGDMSRNFHPLKHYSTFHSSRKRRFSTSQCRLFRLTLEIFLIGMPQQVVAAGTSWNFLKRTRCMLGKWASCMINGLEWDIGHRREKPHFGVWRSTVCDLIASGRRTSDVQLSYTWL